jgi:hypothetical protein
MHSENAVHRVVKGVVDARTIVEALLEDKIQEAGQLYMRAFGPDIPDKGYFFSGSNPIRDFIQQEVPDANFKNVRVQTYTNKFVNLGYTFVVSDGKAITIFSKIKPNFGNEAVKAMEQSLKLTNQTPVTWNGQTEPAGQLIYGQPVHAQPQAQQPQQQPHAGQIQIGVFGGLAGSGQFQNVGRVDIPEVARSLKDGYATVIRRPNDSIAVVTPENFEFDDEAIQSLEQTFKISPKKKVRWYAGTTKSDAGRDVDALYAIYGGQEADPGAAPYGLSVPPPKI